MVMMVVVLSMAMTMVVVKTRQHNFQDITTMIISMSMIPMLITDATDVEVMSELSFIFSLVS